MEENHGVISLPAEDAKSIMLQLDPLLNIPPDPKIFQPTTPKHVHFTAEQENNSADSAFLSGGYLVSDPEDSFSESSSVDAPVVNKEGNCWICKLDNPDLVPCECPPSFGSAHKMCLVSWMNSHFKGRCPRCAFSFRVATHEIPLRGWGADPLMKRNSVKHALVVCLNATVTILCIAIIAKLLRKTPDSASTRIKSIIAGTIGLAYLFYCFCQIRMYCKMYERLRVYNNKVWDVFGKEEEGECNVRGNLSSFVKDYELP